MISMKLDTQPEVIERSGVGKEHKFHISKQNVKHIMRVLRDQLYRNKLAAVVREYFYNAQDAHLMSGQADLPLQVTLPTQLDPRLIIRDFGPGMLDEEVGDTFCSYGESTKRDTDDAAGCLGIGCKAGFAYADAFTVASYRVGTKSTYGMYLDESGEGRAPLLERVPTSGDEYRKTGMEIIIPIIAREVSQVADLVYFYGSFLKVPLRINGEVANLKPTVLDSGDGWAVVKSSNLQAFSSYKHFAVMAGVPYPISDSIVEGLLREITGKGIVSFGGTLLLEFAPREITFVASREDLEMNDLTRQALKARFAKVISDFRGRLPQFKSFSELLAWKSPMKEMIFMLGGADVTTTDGKVIRLTSYPIVKVSDRSWWLAELDGEDVVLELQRSSRWSDSTFTFAENVYIRSSECKQISARCRTLLDAGAKNVVVINQDAMPAAELAQITRWITPIPLESVPPTLRPRAAKTGQKAGLDELISRGVEYSWTKAGGWVRRQLTPDTLPEGEEAYCFTFDHTDKVYTLGGRLVASSHTAIKLRDTTRPIVRKFYVVPKMVARRVKEVQWQCLSTYVGEKITKWLSMNKAQLVKASRLISATSGWRELGELLIGTQLLPGPAKVIQQAALASKASRMQTRRRLCAQAAAFCGPEIANSFDTGSSYYGKDIAIGFNNRYPLVKQHRSYGGKELTHLLWYIKSVDKEIHEKRKAIEKAKQEAAAKTQEDIGISLT